MGLNASILQGINRIGWEGEGCARGQFISSTSLGGIVLEVKQPPGNGPLSSFLSSPCFCLSKAICLPVTHWAVLFLFIHTSLRPFSLAFSPPRSSIRIMFHSVLVASVTLVARHESLSSLDSVERSAGRRVRFQFCVRARKTS